MLHQLIEYARRENLASEPGFKPKSVRWLILFAPDGRFIAPVMDLTGGEKKSKGREFAKCPELTFPELISGKLRHFLIDSLDKVALFTKEDATEKETGDHNSFVSLLEKATCVLPSLSAIASSLRDDEVLVAIQNDLKERKAKPTDSATIGLLTGSTPEIFVESSDWHYWWRDFRRSLADSKQAAASTKSKSAAKAKGQMRCFLSGELIDPAPTQLKITGLSDVGGLSMGDVISSFDKESFGHFNFSQGENAAMSEEMVKTFTDALNHLIQRKSIRLAETKVVYWYSKPVSGEDDFVKDLFAGTELEDDKAETDSKKSEAPSMQQIASGESKARKLLESIRSGERADLANCEFFAVTLSGNSGRVVIRDWMQGRFEDIAESIDAWFRDLSLMNLLGRNEVKPPTLMRLLTSALKEKKLGQNFENWFAPVVTSRAGVWNAALKGNKTPIPRSLVEKACLRQVAAAVSGELPGGIRGESEDGGKTPLRLSAWYGRLALMKVFCIRNQILNSKENNVLPNLDVNHERSSYHVGRLMAVLQMIQFRAQGELGTTIAQSHYAAAATRPIVALPRLETLTQHHLPKIGKDNPELRDKFVLLLTEIKGQIGNKIERTFDLEDQCYFHLGYYQQLAYEPYTEPARRHTTMKGEKVCSMAELVIANWLYSNKVEYEYAAELKLENDRVILPDFTVRKSPVQMTVFIEHLGMMDNFRYQSDWKKKLDGYAETGIKPFSDGGGKNGALIVTKLSGDGYSFNCQELAEVLAPLVSK
jgi:CRISPR-associated protein Csd1